MEDLDCDDVEDLQMSTHDLNMLVKYLDDIKLDFKGSGRPLDGMITLPELEAAFRRTRRQQHMAERASLRSLIEFTTAAKMSLAEWFEEMDSSIGGRHQDGMVNRREVQIGMNKLAERLKQQKMHAAALAAEELNLKKIFKAMDEDQNGTISLEEIVVACNVEVYKNAMNRDAMKVFELMHILEEHMTRHSLRIKDIFRRLDVNGSDTLSSAELRCGLASILEEMKRGRLLKKRQLKQKELREQERLRNKQDEERRQQEMKDKLKQLDAEAKVQWQPVLDATEEEVWAIDISGCGFKHVGERQSPATLIAQFTCGPSASKSGVSVLASRWETLSNVKSYLTETLEWKPKMKRVPAGSITSSTCGPKDNKDGLDDWVGGARIRLSDDSTYIEKEDLWLDVLSGRYGRACLNRLVFMEKWAYERVLSLLHCEVSVTGKRLTLEILREVWEVSQRSENLWLFGEMHARALAIPLAISSPDSIDLSSAVSLQVLQYTASIWWKLSEYVDFLPLLKSVSTLFALILGYEGFPHVASCHSYHGF
jgi:Ca2+-binding EF-hand superfamily protein